MGAPIRHRQDQEKENGWGEQRGLHTAHPTTDKAGPKELTAEIRL